MIQFSEESISPVLRSVGAKMLDKAAKTGKADFAVKHLRLGLSFLETANISPQIPDPE
jgi:hypothetical protein